MKKMGAKFAIRAAWICSLAVLINVSVAGAEVIRIEFENLPYPDHHNLTDEFSSQGIMFSADDTGIGNAFPCIGNGDQENMVLGGVLFNLFRINFIGPGRVVSVRCEFTDWNNRDQEHGLYELDADLNVMQSVIWDDRNGADFTLGLNNPAGIFGVAACEQPYGAERFVAIEFTTEDDDPCIGEEFIRKARCRTRRGAVRKVVVVVKRAEAGRTYEAVLDSGESLSAVANDRGKVKFRFRGDDAPDCGPNGVTVCGLRATFDCDCS